jgi:hypothetical protein
MKLDNLRFDDDVSVSPDAVQVEVDNQVPITQQIWRVIKDRPGVTTKELETLMPEHGNNVSTRLTQMLNGKKLARKETFPTGYAWYAIGDTYPIYRGAGRPKGAKAKKKVTYHGPAKLEVIKPAPTYSVENMNVAQARGLYLELHKIFGGAK